MATNVTLLMGEIIEDPENQPLDVENLLMAFLNSLIDEKKSAHESLS